MEVAGEVFAGVGVAASLVCWHLLWFVFGYRQGVKDARASF